MVANMERIVYGLSRLMQIAAGACLVSMVGLTTIDVILRGFGRPIAGTYEITAYLGGMAVGFSVPITSWFRGHIFVDFFYQKFSRKVQNCFHYTTRVMCIMLFLFTAWNLIKMGTYLQRAGEVSMTLNIPSSWIAYGIGFAFFVQTFVLILDVVKIKGEKYE